MFDRKEYYQKTKELQKETAKLWRLNNPDEARQQRRNQGSRNRLNHPAKMMLKRAQGRAKAAGIPFDIELNDIIIPTHCPVLGIELNIGSGLHSDNSPSLDRIIPDNGYTKGNVIVVSWRANRIKCDATPTELMKLAEFYSVLIR
jgi:hypothetical protein